MEIIRQGEYNSIYGDNLQINWPITWMCNYNCSYCFGHNKLDKSRFSSWSDLKHAVDVLASLNRSSYEITISGGEATAHPHMADLANELHKKLGKKLRQLILTTNGSRDIDYFIDLARVGMDIPFSLNISIHTEYIHLDKIVSLVENCSESFFLSFALMINPVKFDYVKGIFYSLLSLRKEYPFVVTLNHLLSPPDYINQDKRYTPEHLEWIKNACRLFFDTQMDAPMFGLDIPRSGFWEIEENNEKQMLTWDSYDKVDLEPKGLLNFKGMYCVCGASSLAILPNGDTRGSNCQIKAIRDSKSYNIFHENPYEHDDFIFSVPCPNKYCSCSINYGMPKFRDMMEAEQYIASAKRRFSYPSREQLG